MNAIRLQEDGIIRLPDELRSLYPADSELVIWSDGDTLIIKRVAPIRPAGIAERAPEEPVPISEIDREVHRYRRAKRARRG